MPYRRPRLIALLLVLLLGSILAGCTPSAHQAVASAPPGAVVPQAPLGQGVQGVTLLVYPDQTIRKLTTPIRDATRRIDLTVYLLTDHTLIHDLEYAHANGVQVRVLLEPHPFGSGVSGPDANQSAYDQLYAADIPVRWSSARFTLTHEKTMIVDQSTAYILTLNFTKSAFTMNREFGIVDTDSADVREAEAIFDADWRGVSYSPRDPNLLVSPINSRARLLALLARAQRRVDIYAEEVQDGAIEAALVACARRRVRVRLISNVGDATNAAGIARLRAGGVQVHLVSSPYIHAKMVLVDDRWAFVGSENFSPTSLDANRELGVLVADPDALAQLAATFNQDWGA